MSHRCESILACLFLSWLVFCAPVLAAQPEAGKPRFAPRPTPEQMYAKAPPGIGEYLLKARAADRIADPMARCLAFPEPPGSHWAPGLVRAHCEYVFAPRLGLTDIQQRLDANDTAGLDALIRAMLDRHFSESDFSEAVHAPFALFDSSYEAGRLSKLWLDKAPDSPFALTARASFYESMSWSARGAKYAAETPQENLDRMKEFQDKAVELYAQAIDREPRMLPAYAGLVRIDRSGRSRFDAEKAFERGRAVDPACKELLSARMDKLRPRWGGSYPQMLALEKDMEPYYSRRPLLALSRIWPYEDLNDSLYRAKRYDEAVAALQPMVALSSSPQVFEEVAMAMAAQDEADRWLELAYLVEATRFRTGRAAVAHTRGRQQLLLVRDYEMANASLAAALAEDPEDPYTHYLHAASLWGLGKFDDAEREYLVAMKDPNNRRDSLVEVSSAMIQAGKQDKAKTYAELLTKEYPDFARGWWQKARANAPGPMEPIRAALETFLDKADPTDPAYSMDVLSARRGLEQMKAEVLRTGGKW